MARFCRRHDSVMEQQFGGDWVCPDCEMRRHARSMQTV